MVVVRMPPPIGGISPTHVTLGIGEVLIRIFDPTRYGAQRIRADRRLATTGDATASRAISFRSYGPISRFDHHGSYKNKIDLDRSVIYTGRTLSCCLVEIFGDGGIIVIEQQQVAFLTLTNNIKLLDIRGSGARKAGLSQSSRRRSARPRCGAGTVAAISSITQRDISQAWGRYFYEHPELYDEIEGLIFSGAHNGEDAIVLYERAKPKIESAGVEILNLNHPDLVAPILEIAEVHGLLIK